MADDGRIDEAEWLASEVARATDFLLKGRSSDPGAAARAWAAYMGVPIAWSLRGPLLPGDSPSEGIAAWTDSELEDGALLDLLTVANARANGVSAAFYPLEQAFTHLGDQDSPELRTRIVQAFVRLARAGLVETRAEGVVISIPASRLDEVRDRFGVGEGDIDHSPAQALLGAGGVALLAEELRDEMDREAGPSPS